MKKQIKINNLIFEKIKFRYDFFSLRSVHDRVKMNKLILDSFYPHDLAEGIVMNSNNIRFYGMDSQNQTGYAISQRVSTDTGARRLHISELVTMLGYTKTDIAKMLQQVKNLKLNCVLVGLGGTGSNFLHWLYEMSEWTGKVEIFDKISAYDDDEFDIPNMLRIPFIPEFGLQATITPLKVNCIPQKFKNLAKIFALRPERLNNNNLRQGTVGRIPETFIYGAPDIETRQFLTESEFTFFAATHRDGEYSIVENPSVDNDLMMETYGKINLSKFFLNHLSMTIDFLKYLTTRDRSYTTQVINREIIRNDFNEHFKVQMELGFKAGSKKLFIPSSTMWIHDLNLPEGA